MKQAGKQFGLSAPVVILIILVLAALIGGVVYYVQRRENKQELAGGQEGAPGERPETDYSSSPTPSPASRGESKGVVIPPRTGTEEWAYIYSALGVTVAYWLYRRQQQRFI